MEVAASFAFCAYFASEMSLRQLTNRGLPVDKALNILTFSPKKGAEIVKKVLESAIANAEHNEGADADELCVKRVFVDHVQP